MDSKKLLNSGTHQGSKTPNLNNDIDLIYVHCDLVDRGIHLNGRDTDIIYSFSTSLLHPSSNFSIDAKRIIYMPVNKHIISSIRMYLTDKNNQLIR